MLSAASSVTAAVQATRELIETIKAWSGNTLDFSFCDWEVLHTNIGTARRAKFTLNNSETQLRATTRPNHASATNHETVRVRGARDAFIHPIAMFVPDEVQHSLHFATAHFLHPPENCWRVHPWSASQIAVVPVAQEDYRVHRTSGANKTAKRCGMRCRDCPIVGS